MLTSQSTGPEKAPFHSAFPGRLLCRWVSQSRRRYNMKKRSLVSSILDSLEEANRQYEEWSGGAWLSDYGAEGLLVAEIAKNLFKTARKDNKNSFITVEEDFCNICECCNAAPKIGPPFQILNRRNRADIVLWKSSNKVYGVVEVKRKWSRKECFHDIERINKLINTYGKEYGGSLDFACLAVFMSRGQDPIGKKLADKYEKIKEELKQNGYQKIRVKTITPYFTKNKRYPENEGYSQGGMVIEFY